MLLNQGFRVIGQGGGNILTMDGNGVIMVMCGELWITVGKLSQSGYNWSESAGYGQSNRFIYWFAVFSKRLMTNNQRPNWQLRLKTIDYTGSLDQKLLTNPKLCFLESMAIQ